MSCTAPESVAVVQEKSLNSLGKDNNSSYTFKNNLKKKKKFFFFFSIHQMVSMKLLQTNVKMNQKSFDF